MLPACQYILEKLINWLNKIKGKVSVYISKKLQKYVQIY